MDKTKDKPQMQHIYLNIDHLKKGNYIFNFMIENKVHKTVKIKKTKDNKS
ncbi:hypothetical protein [Hyunsoonleella flava]|nr:hypothetical protein [Hyunsoonleella flava]